MNLHQSLKAAYPIGCPSDTAPPLTLTFAGSMSSILMLARTTTLKASLISHMVMSSFFNPAASSTWNTQQNCIDEQSRKLGKTDKHFRYFTFQNQMHLNKRCCYISTKHIHVHKAVAAQRPGYILTYTHLWNSICRSNGEINGCNCSISKSYKAQYMSIFWFNINPDNCNNSTVLKCSERKGLQQV